jgi:hypothetical protein
MTTASFTWSDGTSGGKVITDYKIQSDQATNIWVTIAEGVLVKSYTATDLYPGLTYKFRVFARNSVGYSSASDSVSILTAIVPAAPNTPATYVEANNVRVVWEAPSVDSLDAYGSAISAYRVLIRSDSDTYHEELTYCDGS